ADDDDEVHGCSVRIAQRGPHAAQPHVLFDDDTARVAQRGRGLHGAPMIRWFDGDNEYALAPLDVYFERAAGDIDPLQAIREPARRDAFAATERSHQVVVATTTAHLQWTLRRIDINLEHQTRVVAQATRKTQVHFDLDVRPERSVRAEQVERG